MRTIEQPHLVFLHGLFGSPGDFDAARALLPCNVPTLAPQLPIASAGGNAELIEDVVSFLGRVLADATDGPSILVGSSLGGNVALSFALRNPERVRGLLLTGASVEGLAPFLPSITAPTLLLWGAEDTITPPAVARQFRALMPNTRLLFVVGAGHAPMLERPAPFAFHLAAFLNDLAPRPRQEDGDEKTEREAA